MSQLTASALEKVQADLAATTASLSIVWDNTEGKASRQQAAATEALARAVASLALVVEELANHRHETTSIDGFREFSGPPEPIPQRRAA